MVRTRRSRVFREGENHLIRLCAEEGRGAVKVVM